MVLVLVSKGKLNLDADQHISTTAQNSGFGPYITQGTSAVTTIAPPAVLWAGVFRGCDGVTTVATPPGLRILQFRSVDTRSHG